MGAVQNNYVELFVRFMEEERASQALLEPFPFPFGTGRGMNTHEAPARLDVTHESHPLGVGIKYIVVGIGENNRVVFFEIVVGEYTRVFGNIQLKAVLIRQRLDGLDRIGNVIVDKAFSVLCIKKYVHFVPFYFFLGICLISSRPSTLK